MVLFFLTKCLFVCFIFIIEVNRLNDHKQIFLWPLEGIIKLSIFKSTAIRVLLYKERKLQKLCNQGIKTKARAAVSLHKCAHSMSFLL